MTYKSIFTPERMATLRSQAAHGSNDVSPSGGRITIAPDELLQLLDTVEGSERRAQRMADGPESMAAKIDALEIERNELKERIDQHEADRLAMSRAASDLLRLLQCVGQANEALGTDGAKSR